MHLELVSSHKAGPFELELDVLLGSRWRRIRDDVVVEFDARIVDVVFEDVVVGSRRYLVFGGFVVPSAHSRSPLRILIIPVNAQSEYPFEAVRRRRFCEMAASAQRFQPRARALQPHRESLHARVWTSELGVSDRHRNERQRKMVSILWLLAVILVIAGVVIAIRGQVLGGIALVVVGLLIGPGGVSVFA